LSLPNTLSKGIWGSGKVAAAAAAEDSGCKVVEALGLPRLQYVQTYVDLLGTSCGDFV
jgi:hypothetical protein